MDSQETEIPNPIIDEIVAKDKKAFDQWVVNPDNQRRLDIPKEALRYLLIPRRILELAEDPNNVDVAIIQNLPLALDALVIEKISNPVSNPESFNTYVTEKRNHQRSSGSAVPVPVDVDSFHASHVNIIAMGVIGLNDYVTNYIALSNTTSPEDLYVSDYQDREEIQGKGVATSFYSRLREVAKSLGFRFITGMNLEEKARNFFIRSGRFSLNQIKTRLRGKFYHNPDNPFLTVDFLYREDREKYLIKSSDS